MAPKKYSGSRKDRHEEGGCPSPQGEDCLWSPLRRQQQTKDWFKMVSLSAQHECPHLQAEDKQDRLHLPNFSKVKGNIHLARLTSWPVEVCRALLVST